MLSDACLHSADLIRQNLGQTNELQDSDKLLVEALIRKAVGVAESGWRKFVSRGYRADTNAIRRYHEGWRRA